MQQSPWPPKRSTTKTLLQEVRLNDCRFQLYVRLTVTWITASLLEIASYSITNKNASINTGETYQSPQKCVYVCKPYVAAPWRPSPRTELSGENLPGPVIRASFPLIILERNRCGSLAVEAEWKPPQAAESKCLQQRSALKMAHNARKQQPSRGRNGTRGLIMTLFVKTSLVFVTEQMCHSNG